MRVAFLLHAVLGVAVRLIPGDELDADTPITSLVTDLFADEETSPEAFESVGDGEKKQNQAVLAEAAGGDKAGILSRALEAVVEGAVERTGEEMSNAGKKIVALAEAAVGAESPTADQSRVARFFNENDRSSNAKLAKLERLLKERSSVTARSGTGGAPIVTNVGVENQMTTCVQADIYMDNWFCKNDMCQLGDEVLPTDSWFLPQLDVRRSGQNVITCQPWGWIPDLNETAHWEAEGFPNPGFYIGLKDTIGQLMGCGYTCRNSRLHPCTGTEGAAATYDRSQCADDNIGGLIGDPHITRLDGTQFDLNEDGMHDLLLLPESGEDFIMSGTVSELRRKLKGGKGHFLTALDLSGLLLARRTVQVEANPFKVILGQQDLELGETILGDSTLTTKTDGIELDTESFVLRVTWADVAVSSGGYLELQVEPKSLLNDVGGIMKPVKTVSKIMVASSTEANNLLYESLV